jgi:hypothetical protein
VASDVDARLRAEVTRRARHRCEYCLIQEQDAGFAHEVDHIVSRKHGGLSTSDNLAYACVLCNRYKGSDVASVGSAKQIVRLFHPRKDRWSDHFRIQGELIEPISEVGQVTVGLLRLNAAERLAERKLLQSVGNYPIV